MKFMFLLKIVATADRFKWLIEWISQNPYLVASEGRLTDGKATVKDSHTTTRERGGWNFRRWNQRSESTVLSDVFHGPSEDQKLYWHWPQPQPISVPAFAWKCRFAWWRNLAGYSVWFVATLIPEENRFVSWLAPPNNLKHIVLRKSLFFASCLCLIEVGAFMRFNDPLRTHVFGCAPNTRKRSCQLVHFFCFMYLSFF